MASDGDLDWIHINTIQWLGGGTVLLSSRETSTVIKLADIYGTPTVDWLMGSPDFWAGSGFEDKLLQAQGDFSLNAGQHSVTYLPSPDTATTGCYQVLLYDNNLVRPRAIPSSTGPAGRRGGDRLQQGHAFVWARVRGRRDRAYLRARGPDRRAVFGLRKQCTARRRFE